MPTQSLVIQDFTNGITDNYLRGKPGESYQLYNFLIDENGNPYTRPGFFVHSERVPISSTSFRVSGMYLDSEPFALPIAFRGERAYNMSSTGTWVEILGPTNNSAIPSKTNSDQESAIVWQKQLIYASSPTTVLPHRIYCSDLSPRTFNALTLGLPALATTPTLASAGGSGNNYLYAFHFSYTFTDYDGTVYEESGPVLFAAALENVGAPNTNAVTISGIPVLANTAYSNYATTDVKVRIYRNISNGAVQYFLKQVNNGTTTTTDSVASEVLALNEQLYTTGGVLDFTQPPAGTQFVTQVNDFFWYATSKLVTHSNQGAPGAAPAEFQTFTDQLNMGLGKILTFPILFCDRSIYRLEGNFDEFGDGGFSFREISKDAGCVSNRSIVEVPGGLVWAGNGGFYFTDGYQVTKISTNLSPRYATWRNSSIAGTFDKLRNVVFWSISGANSVHSAPNNELAALHLNFGLKPTCTFTTLGSAYNIYPMSLAYSDASDIDTTFRSKLLVGDANGYLFYMDEQAFTDAWVDSQVYPSLFKKQTIMYRWESVATDQGDPSSRDYFTDLIADFNHQTELAVQFSTRRDDGGTWGSFSEIKQDGAIIWGITEYGWDDPADDIDHDWDSLPVIDGIRKFPKGQLRSARRQFAMSNSLTWIAHSDDYATVTSSTTAKTLTLNDAAFSWPDDCEGYFLSFAADEYVATWKIKERVSATVVKVWDPYGTLAAGSTIKWQMSGYRKFERAHLLSITALYDSGEQSFIPNRGTTGEVNA